MPVEIGSNLLCAVIVIAGAVVLGIAAWRSGYRR